MAKYLLDTNVLLALAWPLELIARQMRKERL